MTKEDFAERLTGRERGKEITREEAAEARAAGLVVVFGVSDDIMVFRGAIEEEVLACNGGEVLVMADGLFDYRSCSEECCHYEKAKKEAEISGKLVMAFWDSGDEYAWTIATMIPHAEFEIVEDGQGFCRGIVFAMADVNGESR